MSADRRRNENRSGSGDLLGLCGGVFLVLAVGACPDALEVFAYVLRQAERARVLLVEAVQERAKGASVAGEMGWIVPVHTLVAEPVVGHLDIIHGGIDAEKME